MQDVQRTPRRLVGGNDRRRDPLGVGVHEEIIGGADRRLDVLRFAAGLKVGGQRQSAQRGDTTGNGNSYLHDGNSGSVSSTRATLTSICGVSAQGWKPLTPACQNRNAKVSARSS